MYSSVLQSQLFKPLVPEQLLSSECALVVFMTEDGILVYSSLPKCQLLAALVPELAPQGVAPKLTECALVVFS